MNILARFYGIIVEYKYAVLCGARHIVSRKTELFYRAEHSLGQNAAKLARLYFGTVVYLCHDFFTFGAIAERNKSALEDVCRRGNYLQLPLSAIDLAYYKSFGVGMSFYFLYKSDTDIFYFGADKFRALHFRAGLRHVLTEFFRFYIVRLYEIGQPIK